jgi:putative mRNA 3-end processing factor
MICVGNFGLYCPVGDFYIDPWRPVLRAVITHAHFDHACIGSGSYICAATGVSLLRERMGKAANICGIPYREIFKMGDAEVSFHPSGHILGSAQVRIKVKDDVWVITGDFKNDDDLSCDRFEVVPCNTLVSESTFALPIYQWPEVKSVFADMNNWWRENQASGKTSIILAYALGKAQRVLCGLNPEIGPIGTHGAVEKLNEYYREAGKPLPLTVKVEKESAKMLRRLGLIVAPLSVKDTSWLKQFEPYSLAFASGWMRVRGARMRGAYDKGFILSDHADWPGLLSTIRATGARRVGVTHGFADILARWLREEEGLEAFTLPTRFIGESVESANIE